MFLTTILAAINRRLRIRSGMRHMAELDDHMLADLGITRAEIPAVARRGR